MSDYAGKFLKLFCFGNMTLVHPDNFFMANKELLCWKSGTMKHPDTFLWLKSDFYFEIACQNICLFLKQTGCFYFRNIETFVIMVTFFFITVSFYIEDLAN